MSPENPVRLTTRKVMQNARDVKINQAQIEKIANKWIKRGIEIPAWPMEMHLETDDPRKMLDYLIILDSLNFCFWPAQPKSKEWHIVYKNKECGGYFALSLALKKFFEENPQKANLAYFSHISFQEFTLLFYDGRNLQFLKERWEIARKVSEYIIIKYRAAELFISSAENKLSALVSKIADELYSFNDIASYREIKKYRWSHSGITAVGEKEILYFWKRAQILAIDILGTFNNKGIGYFIDPEYATAFADYKLPQILRHWGILEYSPALEKKIRNKIIIPAGSKEEIEIRSATIWAVEYLRAAMARRGKRRHAFEIDWLLWNESQNAKMRLPHHCTKTIFY